MYYLVLFSIVIYCSLIEYFLKKVLSRSQLIFNDHKKKHFFHLKSSDSRSFVAQQSKLLPLNERFFKGFLFFLMINKVKVWKCVHVQNTVLNSAWDFVLFSALKVWHLSGNVLLTLHQCVSSWHISQNVRTS